MKADRKCDWCESDQEETNATIRVHENESKFICNTCHKEVYFD